MVLPAVAKRSSTKSRSSVKAFFERQIAAEQRRAKKTGTPARELAWVKSFGKRPVINFTRLGDFKALIEQMDPITAFLYSKWEKSGHAVFARPRKGSRTISTEIHSHPDREGFFSLEDISSFLETISQNKHLRFSVIEAHNSQGKEVGRTFLYYPGKISDAATLRQKFIAEKKELFDKRRKEMEAHPERFLHLSPGIKICTVQEQIDFMKKFIQENGLRLKFVPTKGHAYDETTQRYE